MGILKSISSLFGKFSRLQITLAFILIALVVIVLIFIAIAIVGTDLDLFSIKPTAVPIPTQRPTNIIGAVSTPKPGQTTVVASKTATPNPARTPTVVPTETPTIANRQRTGFRDKQGPYQNIAIFLMLPLLLASFLEVAGRDDKPDILALISPLYIFLSTFFPVLALKDNPVAAVIMTILLVTIPYFLSLSGGPTKKDSSPFGDFLFYTGTIVFFRGRLGVIETVLGIVLAQGKWFPWSPFFSSLRYFVLEDKEVYLCLLGYLLLGLGAYISFKEASKRKGKGDQTISIGLVSAALGVLAYTVSRERAPDFALYIGIITAILSTVAGILFTNLEGLRASGPDVLQRYKDTGALGDMLGAIVRSAFIIVVAFLG